MTKLRPPLSIDAALARIAGFLPGSWGEMARITGRTEGLVRSWGDPDRRENIPVKDAISLDLAYRTSGGEGAPIFEVYAAQLDAAGILGCASYVALGLHAAEAIRECGEANAALVAASQPGATPGQRAAAQREVQEAIATLHRSLPMLNGAEALSTNPPGPASTHPSTGPPGG